MKLMRHQFHGYREAADGSYVTTEFIALWFLPLWPVASHRIIRSAGSESGVRDERIPTSWRQAIEGWLFLLGVIVVVSSVVAFIYWIDKYGYSE